MNKLEKKVLETISNKKVNLTNNEEQFKKLEQAMKTYQELIDKGWAKPRGYNIQSIEDAMKSRTSI